MTSDLLALVSRFELYAVSEVDCQGVQLSAAQISAFAKTQNISIPHLRYLFEGVTLNIQATTLHIAFHSPNLEFQCRANGEEGIGCCIFVTCIVSHISGFILIVDLSAQQVHHSLGKRTLF